LVEGSLGCHVHASVDGYYDDGEYVWFCVHLMQLDDL
jgi:hypothetical protein